MAFQTREPSVNSHEDAPQTHAKNVDVTTIGVDIMKVALPRYEKSLSSFVQSISDTVRNYASSCHTTRPSTFLELPMLLEFLMHVATLSHFAASKWRGTLNICTSR